jgi:hypothetical protein
MAALDWVLTAAWSGVAIAFVVGAILIWQGSRVVKSAARTDRAPAAHSLPHGIRSPRSVS